MQLSLSVITPAQDISLVTLYEAKIALNLSDPTLDDQIELMIKWSSAEIAAMCNRTFAQVTVEETFSELDVNGTNRIFLSHWPVTNIDSVDDGGDTLTTDDYSLDANSGTLRRLDGVWSDPVTVVYTGGYDLPNDAPVALQQAATMMTREAYLASSPSGGAAIRMVAHKESRIMYYDPNKSSSASSSGGSSPARRAAAELIKHFMRFPI